LSSPSDFAATPEIAGHWRPRARVAEAALLLALARVLIGQVRLKHWRGTLGRVAPGSVTPSLTEAAPGSPQAQVQRRVVRAVLRGAERLPGDTVCLPRAMAVQWMLKRRGLPSALVFGVLPDHASGDMHALHAWVESGSRVLIGDDPTRSYARGLTLVQP